MLEADVIIRDVIRSELAQNDHLSSWIAEDVDVHFGLPDAVISAALDVLAPGMGSARRENWRGQLELILDYAGLPDFAQFWQKGYLENNAKWQTSVDAIIDVAASKILVAAMHSRQDAEMQTESMLDAIHTAALHFRTKEVQELCKVVVKVAISEVAHSLADSDDYEEEVSYEKLERKARREAKQLVGDEVETAAREFLDDAKEILVGQKPIPGISWPTKLTDSVGDAAIKAIQKIDPTEYCYENTGWAKAILRELKIPRKSSRNGRVERDCNDLKEILEDEADRCRQSTFRRPFLVVLSGLPGTGKSRFAQTLTNFVPFLVLESDQLRKRLVQSPSYNKNENARLFSAIRRLAIQYLAEDMPLLIDATNLRESYRQPIYSIADRLGVPVVTIWFTASPTVIRRRLAKREAEKNPDEHSDATWHDYLRLRDTEDPIGREHISITSSQDVPSVLATLLDRFTTISVSSSKITRTETTAQTSQIFEEEHQVRELAKSFVSPVDPSEEELIGSLYDFIEDLAVQNISLEGSHMFSPEGNPVSLAGYAAVGMGWGSTFQGSQEETTENRRAADVLAEVFRLAPWELKGVLNAEKGETYVGKNRNTLKRIQAFCKNNDWTHEDRSILELARSLEFDDLLGEFSTSTQGGVDALKSFLDGVWRDAQPSDAAALRMSVTRLLASNPDSPGLLMLRGFSEAVSWNGNVTVAKQHFQLAKELAAGKFQLEESLMTEGRVSVFSSLLIYRPGEETLKEVLILLLEDLCRSAGMNRELARRLIERANGELAWMPAEWLLNRANERLSNLVDGLESVR